MHEEAEGLALGGCSGGSASPLECTCSQSSVLLGSSSLSSGTSCKVPQRSVEKSTASVLVAALSLGLELLAKLRVVSKGVDLVLLLSQLLIHACQVLAHGA